MQVRVYDSKSNIERVFTEKAYKILSKQKHYSFMSYIDEDGNEVEGQPQVNGVQKKSQEKSAEPVERKITVMSPIGPVIVPIPKTPEQIEAKKAELAAMNQEAIQKAEEKAAEQAEVKVRQKPGPKPKINNAKA